MNKYFWISAVLACLWGIEVAVADDIDVLGVSFPCVKPNVLIIFDTSGSMDIKDVPEDPYDSKIDYTEGGGGYEKSAVYGWINDSTGGRWHKFVQQDMLDLSCVDADLDDALSGNGQTWGRINVNAPHMCGDTYDEIELRTGNFLNYENGGYAGPMRKRLDVAKMVVKQLIADHPEVRFGLMRFASANHRHNGDTMGGALTDHGDINSNTTVAQLKADVDSLSADSHSPLAETLAEAGLYFAGQGSWYNNLTYTSPIDIKCRPNAIILMTDGDSTKDRDVRLSRQNAYIQNSTIGDYDGDGNDPGEYDRDGSDYLDDVALFLYKNDLRPDLGTGDPYYEKQNVVTHAIGFKKTHQLLQDTAINGGGVYFTAGSAISLAKAFKKILNTIIGTGAILTTPKIPVSRSNGIYAGDFLYMGLFEPGLHGETWRGNLKKYKLDSYGELIDSNNRPATASDGTILDTAQSIWSPVVDGTRVDAGGAGALLVNRHSRKLYTYTDRGDKDLTADINAFSIFNKDNISLSDLNVSNDDERLAIINQIHGIGKQWVMADVLHFEPTVVSYDTNGDSNIDEHDDALIFLGTNGGVMHAFLDSSGEELWGFIPPKQLGRLKRLTDGRMGHGYAIDGTSVVFNIEIDETLHKTLVFGERRGGSNYYAVDITNYDRPVWKYCISDDILGKDAERLGQSWGRPQFVTVATGSASTSDILLLAGGYDTQQDLDEPEGSDERGRAVFSVDADSGAPGPFKFYNDGNNPDMTHSIVDVVGIDSDGDGIIGSIYAPDLGGNMFVFTDDDKDGVWKKLRLFNASSDAKRKIFFSPDVIRIIGNPDPGGPAIEEKIGEMIFFGTGDFAHPKEKKCKNRFYGVKNYDWDSDFNTLPDKAHPYGNGDLHDATQNSIIQGASLEEQQRATDEIKDRMGWFIDLEAEGEKVVSTPVVYNQTVYFTTYIPPHSTGKVADDDCDANYENGEARLYGLNYIDGRAVHDDWSDIKEFDPVTQDEIKSGGKADRYVKIGNSMPSAPVMVIRNGIVRLYIGVGGRLLAMTPKQTVEMNMYYWREINGALKGKH